MKKRTAAFVLAALLVVGGVIGGTIAWLTDTTDPVVNTFTIGDIDIELTETDTKNDSDSNANTNTYKMVPGSTIAKDPKVTVKANSEECWLFVKITESTLSLEEGTTAAFSDFMVYSVASDWTALGDDYPGVYYRTVSASTSDQSFYVLAGDTDNPNGIVTVPNTVTKAMANALTANPTLTFTAYAIQKENMTTATDAWAALNPATP